MVGEARWGKVSKLMGDRSEIQCFNRWLELENSQFTQRGAWTKLEDVRLREIVQKFGARNWTFIASQLPGRIGK
jgi:hypothetical protein